MCSCVKSDHKAVIVNCDVDRENDKKSVEIDRTKVTIYDLNPIVCTICLMFCCHTIGLPL